MASSNRVGIGFDIHRLTAGRPLVLGGVEVPFEKGLTGWSDADVLTHAVMDALLGAAGLGDIGTHFPSGQPEYKGISSLVLLGRVRDELGRSGWQVVNIDATVVAERPRLREFIGQMRERLSQTLGISMNQISVKASTSDNLGVVGRGEGMAAYAVALIESAPGTRPS